MSFQNSSFLNQKLIFIIHTFKSLLIISPFLIIQILFHTMVLSQQFMQIAINNPYVKCTDLHNGNCNIKAIQQFFNSVRSMSKIYLIVHLVPLVLFKRKQLSQNFKKQFLKFLVGYIKSLCFSGFHPAGARRSICFLTQHWGYHGILPALAGFLPGLSLLVESPGRQCEIALYVVNKSIQTLYYQLKRRNYVKQIKYGEAILFGIGIAILCYFYINSQEDIKQNYLSVMKKVIGDV